LSCINLKKAIIISAIVVKMLFLLHGEIIYFAHKDGTVHHSTIITKVIDGEIYYAGHTNSILHITRNYRKSWGAISYA